jgi:hypothetical protein
MLWSFLFSSIVQNSAKNTLKDIKQLSDVFNILKICIKELFMYPFKLFSFPRSLQEGFLIKY